jgi:hypothetical protein
MEISAELRWFWFEQCPEQVEAWFMSENGRPPAGGGKTRTDEYLHDPGQRELGLKIRGAKPGVEVKGLVTRLPADGRLGAFVGAVEIWCKWTSTALDLGQRPRSITRKQRWLRKFDTTGEAVVEVPLDQNEGPLEEHERPNEGCNFEFTRVEVILGEAKSTCWTLGLEAFGSYGKVESNLRRAIENLGTRRPPSLATGQLMNYPVLLSNLAKQG